MVARTKSDGGTPSNGRWLLMFYVAADNNLSALFVDQLKALKDAGFAKNVEIIVRFDPHEPDIKTRTFRVNKHRKLQYGAPAFKIGDGTDPFVRNMIEDFLFFEFDKGKFAFRALDRFIAYCLKNHEADHYMLFLLGHGLIVGNDAFLPDEFPKSGISLEQLGFILRKHFGRRPLELLGMQACAMSGIEVLYELQGTARYMLGSEGLSFVNGWPYRQLIKGLFNSLKKRHSIERIVRRFYWFTFYNAKDFLLAGFPLELSLVSLDPRKVSRLTPKIQNLVRLLKKALRDQHDLAPQDAIQLAHLKSQSYFDEFYTDLYDFCLCLQRQCENNQNLEELGEACQKVRDELEPDKELIIYSNHFGGGSQYSHGLSILLPWVEPRKNVDEKKQVMAMYKRYAFTRALKSESWFSFLQEYFIQTKRHSREEEDGYPNLRDAPKRFRLAGDDRKNWIGALEKPTGATEKPTGGTDSSSCDCPSIKNFPKDKDTDKGNVVIL